MRASSTGSCQISNDVHAWLMAYCRAVSGLQRDRACWTNFVSVSSSPCAGPAHVRLYQLALMLHLWFIYPYAASNNSGVFSPRRTLLELVKKSEQMS